MKRCAYCGNPVESGLVIHSECTHSNDVLRKEADDNAALAMDAKARADKLATENAELQKRLEVTKIALNNALGEMCANCCLECKECLYGDKDTMDYFLQQAEREFEEVSKV